MMHDSIPKGFANKEIVVFDSFFCRNFFNNQPGKQNKNDRKTYK
jgi:hypothetical protein